VGKCFPGGGRSSRKENLFNEGCTSKKKGNSNIGQRRSRSSERSRGTVCVQKTRVPAGGKGGQQKLFGRGGKGGWSWGRKDRPSLEGGARGHVFVGTLLKIAVERKISSPNTKRKREKSHNLNREKTRRLHRGDGSIAEKKQKFSLQRKEGKGKADPSDKGKKKSLCGGGKKSVPKS